MFVGLIVSVPAVLSQDNGSRVSSYMPVDIHEAFASIMARMSAAKPEIVQRQKTLLEQRYDGNHAVQNSHDLQNDSGGQACAPAEG